MCRPWTLISLLVLWLSELHFSSAQHPYQLDHHWASSSRCLRSLPMPLYHFIPVRVYTPQALAGISEGTESTESVERTPRQQQQQQQTVVVQQQQQSSGFGGFGRPGFGGPGFGRPGFGPSRGGFGGGFGGSFGGGFGAGFRGRSYEEEKPNENIAQTIPAPTCPQTYIISCGASLEPVPCATGNCNN